MSPIRFDFTRRDRWLKVRDSLWSGWIHCSLCVQTLLHCHHRYGTIISGSAGIFLVIFSQFVNEVIQNFRHNPHYSLDY